MAVGFELYTDDGFLQLTANQLYFRIESKVVLNPPTQQGLLNGGTMAYQDVFVSGPTMADNPVVALSSSQGSFATVSAATNGVTVRVSWLRKSANPPAITLYVFSSRRPPATNFGMELYDENQNVVMNTAYPPLRLIGSYANGSYSGLDISGRRLAHIPQQIRLSSYRLFTSAQAGSCFYPGIPNNAGYQQFEQDGWNTGMVACQDGSISGDSYGVQVGPFAYQCAPSSQTPTSSNIDSGNVRSLIADVSGI